jgi:Lipopolysaccharide kinase (Kdo/WaaP) family
VPCLTGTDQGVTIPRPGRIRASLVSLGCFLGGLPLFFRATPRTPLRVLCVIALDTVHVLRTARPLPRSRCHQLAAFLDFQACTNAVWDGKDLYAPEYRALRERLERVGLGVWITEYLSRLRELELRRPPIGGDLQRFDDVRSYREAVVRLSLATIAAIALSAECLDEGIRATYCDSDVAALFRMAMQCQIIDDVIDYRQDRSLGLPSFLTATASLPQAIASTADAVRFYAASRGPSAGGGVFPFEAALRVITLVTRLVVGGARMRELIDGSRALASRVYFGLCLVSGRMLRSARYSTVRIIHGDSQRLVRKHRRFYAPLLIWMSGLLVRILDGGVRVLPQRDWAQRERRIYQRLHGASIRVDPGGMLVLPLLAGHTLATLLEDPELEESIRKRAIEQAVLALADFHRLGFTHGDAMAENVLVDLEAGVAHWFDFETIHEGSRPLAWRRADDLRALLATCLLRTAPEKHVETLEFMLDVYGDEDVTRILATSFTSIWQRSLTLHLLQAPLSFQCFCELGRLLRERSRASGRRDARNAR